MRVVFTVIWNKYNLNFTKKTFIKLESCAEEILYSIYFSYCFSKIEQVWENVMFKTRLSHNYFRFQTVWGMYWYYAHVRWFFFLMIVFGTIYVLQKFHVSCQSISNVMCIVFQRWKSETIIEYKKKKNYFQFAFFCKLTSRFYKFSYNCNNNEILFNWMMTIRMIENELYCRPIFALQMS